MIVILANFIMIITIINLDIFCKKYYSTTIKIEIIEFYWMRKKLIIVFK